MSVEAITWALKQPITHSSAKFVLVVLANCANAENGMAWPSVPYLAEATGQDRKTIIANLGRLQEWGLIADTGKRVGETKQIVVYKLRGADLFDGEKRNGSENGTVPKKEPSQNSGKQSRFSREQSQKRDTEPSTTKRNRQPSSPRAALRFDEWWAVYPKKVARKPALEKWKAKHLDAKADELIADVQKRAKSDGRWLDGYVPNPATYLGQERWNDELQPARAAPGAAPAHVSPAAPAATPSPARDNETRLENAINWAKQQHHAGMIDPAERDRLITEAEEKYGQKEPAEC